MKEFRHDSWSDGWKVVETRSQERFKKAKKYLEKTVKSMNDLLAEFELVQGQFQHLTISCFVKKICARI